MPKKEKLTPAEWQIMEAIWEMGGARTVREVLERVFPNGEKAYTTVQTVMNTLEKKKLLRRRKTGLVNFYRPTRSRDEMIKAEMSSLISRVFGGSIPALANSLLSLDDVSMKEIQRIKELLDKKEKELKGGMS
ncbi:MAG: BlaI/MecI/CopY family transcriptional regulator [Candidatus Latescibacterota bacterium]|nr:MAG: BlaI/MecI/CopY family transcriptional regulator [Candidatus Latescibacterota bacterium]